MRNYDRTDFLIGVVILALFVIISWIYKEYKLASSKQKQEDKIESFKNEKVEDLYDEEKYLKWVNRNEKNEQK